MIAMLPRNGTFEGKARSEGRGYGPGPAVLAGWIGGTLLSALALWNGLGWLAALAAYSLGGGLLALVFALLPLIEIRLPQPALRPAYVRARRRH